VPIDGFEVPIDGFEVPIDGFEVPIDGFEVPIDGFEVSIDGFEVSIDGFEVSIDGFEVSIDGFEVSIDGFEVPLDDVAAGPDKAPFPLPRSHFPRHPLAGSHRCAQAIRPVPLNEGDLPFLWRPSHMNNRAFLSKEGSRARGTWDVGCVE
jgi:hypothetical protein